MEYNDYKNIIIKKLSLMLRHSQILKNINIPENVSDELSNKLFSFKISLNYASKIILEYYISYCIRDTVKECDEEYILKINKIIDKVLRGI